jgi:glucose/arabinose dehydrogenase
VPDVLLQSHSLGMMFYAGQAFPEAYRGNAFAAQHGSWKPSAPYGIQGHPLADELRAPSANTSTS